VNPKKDDAEKRREQIQRESRTEPIEPSVGGGQKGMTGSPILQKIGSIGQIRKRKKKDRNDQNGSFPVQKTDASLLEERPTVQRA